MIPPPTQDRLSAVAARPVRGTFFRALLAAFAADPLSIEGSLRHGGRYNPPGAFGVLYCGENPEVCAAEVRKRAAGQPTHAYRLARFRVSVHRILDLTDPATLTTLGLRTDDLVADDWRLTQALGAQARAAGFEGVFVPSAAGPGRNLVIFLDRLEPGSHARPLGSRPFRVPPTP